MNKLNKMKKAFTMLELVFVIVILGIVASIGSTIMAQLFETYIMQRATHRVSLKTELTINQIVNRLTYRIPDSVIAKDPDTNNFVPLEQVDVAVVGDPRDPRIVLEWIGSASDSYKTTPLNAMLWSGYCDTNATVAETPNGTIVSPGSHFNALMTTINNLSPVANPQLALLFNLNGGRFSDAVNSSQPSCYGFTDTNCIHIVGITNDTNLTTPNMKSGANTRITSAYKLAWSAYALVPVTRGSRGGARVIADPDDTLFDLELRYGYQPWNTIQYNNANTSRSIIARNVTSFKFMSQGGTMRVKLCMTEQIGDMTTTKVSICKEKVVMR